MILNEYDKARCMTSINEAVADIVVWSPRTWPVWLTSLLLELRTSLADPAQFDAIWAATVKRMEKKLNVS